VATDASDPREFPSRAAERLWCASLTWTTPTLRELLSIPEVTASPMARGTEKSRSGTIRPSRTLTGAQKKTCALPKRVPGIDGSFPRPVASVRLSGSRPERCRGDCPCRKGRVRKKKRRCRIRAGPPRRILCRSHRECSGFLFATNHCYNCPRMQYRKLLIQSR
jgi:hypothetical protein